MFKASAQQKPDIFGHYSIDIGNAMGSSIGIGIGHIGIYCTYKIEIMPNDSKRKTDNTVYTTSVGFNAPAPSMYTYDITTEIKTITLGVLVRFNKTVFRLGIETLTEEQYQQQIYDFNLLNLNTVYYRKKGFEIGVTQSIYKWLAVGGSYSTNKTYGVIIALQFINN